MKKLLSIDGGGSRGIFALAFLAEMEKDKNISISHHFDFFSGTSIGGIIASALSCGASAQHLLREFPNLVKESFHKRWFHFLPDFIYQAGYPKVSKYKTSRKEAILKNLFKDAQTLKHCMVPAYNIKSRKTTLFKIRPYERFSHLYAHYTSNAPFYFKSDNFLDGAVAINNPTDEAALECEKIWNSKPEILSISCGESSPNPKSLLGLVSTIYDAPNDLIHHRVEKRYGPHYNRICFSGYYKMDTTSNKDLSEMIAKGIKAYHQFKINPTSHPQCIYRVT